MVPITWDKIGMKNLTKRSFFSTSTKTVPIKIRVLYHPLLLYFIFYITLLTPMTIFTIHYSQLLPYYHFHYYPPFIYLILYYQLSYSILLLIYIHFQSAHGLR